MSDEGTRRLAEAIEAFAAERAPDLVAEASAEAVAKARVMLTDALAESLTRQLGGAVTFHVPEGGMAIWARADDSINVADWLRRSEYEGASFLTGHRYDVLGREQQYLRLGFTQHDEKQLHEAVARMARALRSEVRMDPRVPLASQSIRIDHQYARK